MDNSRPPAWVLEKGPDGKLLSHLEWPNLIAFKIWFVGTEVPVPIAANCVPPYQAGKCACRDLSIYKPNLITPTESYGRFEPGGVLDLHSQVQGPQNV